MCVSHLWGAVDKTELEERVRHGEVVAEVDLSGRDLGGASLAGGIFDRVSFTDSWFEGADLHEAMFTSCDFSGSRLDRANLRHAALDKCILKKATAVGACFIGAKLIDADCSALELREAELPLPAFIKGSLREAVLSGATIDRTTFLELDLESTDFSGTSSINSVFYKADLRASKLEQAAFERVVRHCAKKNIPVTLVLVPGEFQLSSSLTAAFCRRMQLEPTDLELALPQRRWSALAEHLQVSKIDLLPALREKGEIVYLPNSAEWNERGQTIVAETIARDLKNRGI